MRAFTVDVEELEAVVADLSATQRQLEHIAADLEIQVRGLHDGWAGVAAVAHQAAHRRWHERLDELRAALTSLAAAGSGAADSYRGASADNVAMWSQVS